MLWVGKIECSTSWLYLTLNISVNQMSNFLFCLTLHISAAVHVCTIWAFWKIILNIYPIWSCGGEALWRRDESGVVVTSFSASIQQTRWRCRERASTNLFLSMTIVAFALPNFQHRCQLCDWQWRQRTISIMYRLPNLFICVTIAVR